MLCISDLEFASRSSSLADTLSSNPASDRVGDLSEPAPVREYCGIEVAFEGERDGGSEDVGVFGVGSR